MKLRKHINLDWKAIFKVNVNACIVLYEYISGRDFYSQNEFFDQSDEFLRVIELFGIDTDPESLKYFFDKFDISFWVEKVDECSYKAISKGYGVKWVLGEFLDRESAIVHCITSSFNILNSHIDSKNLMVDQKKTGS